MGQSVEDRTRIQERFAALLDYCPLPTLIVDSTHLEVIAANDRISAEPGTSLGFVFSAECMEDLRRLELRPGQARSWSTAASDQHIGPIPGPCVLNVSCEDVDGETIYIVTLSPKDDDESSRHQETRFRALADAVPVGIFLTNTEGRVMYVNDRWSEITGICANVAMVRGWLDGVHPDDRARVQHAWTRFLTEPGPFEIQFRYVRGEDQIAIAARAVPFFGDEGTRAGFLGTFADISQQKQAEEKLVNSEARYRSIFENVLDVYYETSLTGDILEVSPSIETLGGFTRSELIGKPILGFYADQSARDRLLQALVERGGLHDYEIELRDRDGSAIPCAISCKLERDQAGNPVKIIGSMRDIRQRKTVEEMLRVERHNLEMIASDAPLPDVLESIVLSVESQAPGMLCSILLVDPDGKRLRIGAAPSLPAEYNYAIDGIAIEPEVGCCARAAATKLRVVVEDISQSPYWAEYKKLAMEHGLRACWSQPILSANGRVWGTFAMYYSQAAAPKKYHLQLIDAATRLASIAIERGHSREEQRNLESQMRQAQKLESLGVLAGGIAHDFNNLLTGIMGYASLASFALRESGSPAGRHVDEIQKVAQRAADLTKQMLAYSGKGRFMVMPLDLGTLVDELAHLLEISISKKARLRYDFDKNLPLVEADPAQVQQVVMNLITNASEALEERPGDIKISTGVVDARREYLAETLAGGDLPEGQYVYVEVMDTGCGMDAETVTRIFDPFFTTKFTGRGLGMSAVLGIMRGHRGTIKIDSEPGRGTTIRLLFPAIAHSVRPSDEPWTNRVVTRENHVAQGTVLVVDDEDMIRNLAASMLAEAGYRVLTAIDGDQALEVYARDRASIDLVLLDLTMPNKDGVETLRALRAQGATIPVILSSGYNEQEVKKRINGDRFDAFVQKPYTRNEMLDRIASILADS